MELGLTLTLALTLSPNAVDHRLEQRARPPIALVRVRVRVRGRANLTKG